MSVLIGCTGGIGSGKSTVAALLSARGAAVISADDLARAALRPGSAGHDVVLGRFGDDVRAPDGSLDRKQLARLVFSDAAARAELEAIVHPVVNAGIAARLSELEPQDRVVVLDSPLLVETRARARLGLDGLLVVDAPEDLAIDRLINLRKIEEADARARIAAQTSRGERLRAADFVIVNMGTLDELAQMADRAWSWIEAVAEGKRNQVR